MGRGKLLQKVKLEFIVWQAKLGQSPRYLDQQKLAIISDIFGPKQAQFIQESRAKQENPNHLKSVHPLQNAVEYASGGLHNCLALPTRDRAPGGHCHAR